VGFSSKNYFPCLAARKRLCKHWLTEQKKPA
jgi:hypothetical protein